MNSKDFFSLKKNDTVFYIDVCFVIEAVGHQHDPTEWHLFIDSLNVSSKAVLLPLTHATNMKESYENTSGKDPVCKI
jgi:hypothetical protein